MRRLLLGTGLLALIVGLGMWPSGAPAGAIGGSTTVDTTTTVAATSTLAPATRGTAAHVASTLPPPPTTVVPPPPSPNTVPANSGTGRRVIYSKSQMRVWIVDASDTLLRTYRVSGRFSQPALGTYSVFSRSSFTCHKGNSSICMRWMVRFTRGPSGDNIGFHEIPRRNGVPMQSDSQLGQALSAGCVRQSTADAQFMWGWAYIGTRVVVIW